MAGGSPVTFLSPPLLGRESADMGSPSVEEVERGGIPPPPQRQPSMMKEPIAKLNRFSSWVFMVICGQLLVLIIALTFFFLIQFSHTPMVQSLAEWGKATPRSLAFCVTIVATLLSSVSTFLFSKGLILFLTSHSNRPATLINFITVSSLSRGAAFISLHHLNWAIVSLLTLVLLNSLTASFTSVITPTSLIVNVPIRGTEFSINSDKFSQAIQDPHVADSLPKMNRAQLNLNNQVAAVIGPLSLTSAYSSASRHLGFPAVMTYLGTTFNSTTGGVLPTIPSEADALAANPAIASSLHFGNVKSHFKFGHSNFKPSKKFPFNYTTVQQGFTVDVNCEGLPADPAPQDAGLKVEFVQNVTLPTQVLSGLWRYFFQCPNQAPTNETILIRPRGSFLLSKTCPMQTSKANEGPGSQLLILGGFGPMYSFIAPRTCQFTPYITLSEVQYSNIVNVSRVISREPITAATEPVARLVYGAIVIAMSQYAVDVRNKVGDDIASLYGITSRLDNIDEEMLNGILEHYFRGLIETYATLVRTPPIVVGRSRLVAASLQELSPEWTRPFEGVWSYETLGWHATRESMGTTVLSIIPILLVTLTSIFLTISSLRSLHRTRYLSEKPFDPNNLVTLLKAGRDASVAEFLGEGDDMSGIASKDNVKIQLHRNSTQWELRPVKNHSPSATLAKVSKSISGKSFSSSKEPAEKF